ncbi:hypothetical protein GCM10010266_45650 [Streptomyces griseomycini]|nr:hypothetical protein GCM10010266_45650 [Streptomyces griseomycini]
MPALRRTGEEAAVPGRCGAPDTEDAESSIDFRTAFFNRGVGGHGLPPQAIGAPGSGPDPRARPTRPRGPVPATLRPSGTARPTGRFAGLSALPCKDHECYYRQRE